MTHDDLEIIEVTNESGRVLCEFDGEIWRFYKDPRNPDVATLVISGDIQDTPYLLLRHLEDFDEPEEMLEKLTDASPNVRVTMAKLERERSELNRRLVLLEREGHGVLDDFTDRIWLIETRNDGFTLSSSVDGDAEGFEDQLNALGEIRIANEEGVFDAQMLIYAIEDLTADDRWEEIEWEWQEVADSLSDRYSELAEQLMTIIAARRPGLPPERRDEYYFAKRIKAYWDIGRLDHALSMAEKAIGIFPFAGVLYAARGETYLLRREPDRAQRDYEAALQLGFEEVSVFNNLGICQMCSHRFRSAIDSFTRAIGIVAIPQTYRIRAVAYRQLGKFALAKNDEYAARQLEIATAGKAISAPDGSRPELSLWPRGGSMLH